MPYVIAGSCIDVMDRSCMEECPVDCIYEGGRKLSRSPAGPSHWGSQAAPPLSDRSALTPNWPPPTSLTAERPR
jgi:hypothetical protein